MYEFKINHLDKNILKIILLMKIYLVKTYILLLICVQI